MNPLDWSLIAGPLPVILLIGALLALAWLAAGHNAPRRSSLKSGAPEGNRLLTGRRSRDVSAPTRPPSPDVQANRSAVGAAVLQRGGQDASDAVAWLSDLCREPRGDHPVTVSVDGGSISAEPG